MTQRKLYHKPGNCPLPAIGDDGAEFHCRCQRTWRLHGGAWMLVVWSAGFPDATAAQPDWATASNEVNK